MKLIIAMIQKSKLKAVENELCRLNINNLMVSEVAGTARGESQDKFTCTLQPAVRLEMAVSDEIAQPITDAIVAVAKTGEKWDGKIFISDLANCVCVKSEEKGWSAVG